MLQRLFCVLILSSLSLRAQDAVSAAIDGIVTNIVNEVQVDEAQPIVVEEAEKPDRIPRELRRHYQPIVQVWGGDVTVKAGETVGDIVIVGGKLRMDGEVRGSVVAIASDAIINGYIRHNLVVVPGPLKIGADAEIRENAVVVGSFDRDPASKIGGDFVPVDMPHMVPFIGGLKDFMFQGILMMRPLPPRVEWVWYAHIGMFLALLGLTLLFPRPVTLGAETIAERPVMSMFSGILTVMLFVPVLALVSLTVIGLPVMILALILSALFGKASVMTFLGQQIGRNLNVELLQKPLVAMVVGALMLLALYMVPIVGMITWGIASLLGIGSIMVATASALNNRPTIPTPTAYPQPAVPIEPLTQPPIAPADTIPGVNPTAPITSAVTIATPTYFRRVGFWKRTFAALLDLLLLSIPMGLAQGFAPLILIAYFVAMWTWKGTSIGKICLGLKIVRIDGTPIDFAVALVRSLASCFSFAVFFLGFFWAGWDKEKQSWHDKIAGTIVVQVPKGVSLL